MRFPSLQGIAHAVWNMVPLAARTVTPNGGTVATVTTVTTLTGGVTLASNARGTVKFKLAGTLTITNGNAANTISIGQSVSMLNTRMTFLGYTTTCNATEFPGASPYVYLLDGDNIRAERQQTNNQSTVRFELVETYP